MYKEWTIDEPYKTQVNNEEKKSSILVVGHVQSGKTRFMINEARWHLNNGYDIAIFLGGSNNLLLNQTFHRVNKDLNEFTIYEIKNRPINRLGQGRKIVITSLKHQTSLKLLIQTLNNLSDRKVVIFDDESDFGGINISRNGSRIFSLIRKLYDTMNHGRFLCVTATPFADILSEDAWDFSEVIRLSPGEGYVGNKEFLESKRLKIIKEHESKQAIIKMLADAILTHIKSIIAIGLDKSQFLINNSLNIKNHNEMKDTLISVIRILRSSKDVFKIFDIKYEKGMKILHELSKNIFIVNGDDSNWDAGVHSIIIGGALVSRGYTFENLLTAILLNNSKKKQSADTLLQRARWFGYRSNIDLMNIYIPKKIYDAFHECQQLIEIVFDRDLSIEDVKEEIEELSAELEYINPTGKVVVDEVITFKRK